MVYYAIEKAPHGKSLIVYLSDKKEELSYSFFPEPKLLNHLDRLAIVELQEGIYESLKYTDEKPLAEALNRLGCVRSDELLKSAKNP